MERTNCTKTAQKPIASGFHGTSTSTEVIKGIDLTGKTAIVTGGNTGIGLETVRTLANAGATVIVPARDIDKAKKNLQGIDHVAIERMDLLDHHSIDAFAKKFLASGRPLHMLINNAGIMWVPLRRDRRGIESQLAVNYLSQYQLTARLWTALKKAKGARVVNVSSQGHQFSPFHFEDPNFEIREYETLQAYGQSKTAVNLFSLELDHRAKAFGVRAYAVHPGAIGGTELAREAPLDLFIKMGFCDERGNMFPEVAASLKSIPQGAATTIWCATSPLLDPMGGVYCEDNNIAGLNIGKEFSAGVRPYSIDKNSAEHLWALSEKMTGIPFQPN